MACGVSALRMLKAKDFDGGGAQTDYSNDPIFLRARQGLTHVATAGSTTGPRLLIIANPLVARGKVQAVLISEFPAEAIESNMETWAFSNNTYNMVFARFRPAPVLVAAPRQGHG